VGHCLLARMFEDPESLQEGIRQVVLLGMFQ
jgi:hypothetical protein